MSEPRKYLTNADRQRAWRQRQQAAQQQHLSQRGLPALPALPTLAGTPRWNAGLAMAQALVAMVHQEMTDYAQQRSQRWQEGERGAEFSERLEAVEELCSQFEQILC